MICTLKLYMKGQFIGQEEVLLSDNADDLVMDDNWMIREIELNAAAQKLKINYLRGILKVNNDYHIEATFQSKMNKYEPAGDFTGSEESD